MSDLISRDLIKVRRGHKTNAENGFTAHSKLLTVSPEELESQLRSAIEGEVRFDDGSRALYATDGSNYRQVPIGVVIPKSVQDVVTTMAICRRAGAPVLSRGGGTSLAGQCCNVAVIMDFSKYLNKVLSLDPEAKLATVQPGCVLDDLRDAAEKHHLTFGPDPSTHSHNSLGGMIGNDSCGVHSILAANQGNGARTADNVEEMEILLYDGTRMTVGATTEEELESIIRAGGRKGDIYGKLRDLRDRYGKLIEEKYPNIPRRVSGYNLEQLLPENGFHVARALAGSEGTCATILSATMNLVNSPPSRSLLVLGYADVFEAGDAAPDILKHKPTGLEGLDDLLIEWMKKKHLHPEDLKLLPDGKGWLLVEFGGDTKEESDAKARELMAQLKKKGKDAPSMKLFDDPAEERLVWEIRESGLGATADVPGESSMWPGWEDSAVPPEKVGPYLRELRKLFEKYDYNTSLYGHFGQGCIHCRIPFDLKSTQGIATFRAFLVEAAHLVVSFGGSLSGEHGDGQSRAELLPIMFGEDLIGAFREFKSIWDPDWKLNPGKVVDAYKVDENLRLGADYSPWQPETHFKYLEDGASFAQATLRCVGVGKCRRHEGGTMCPSYRVTREEMHSTRGRARLLFEMLQGNPLEKGWKNESVKEALDLCLACKGCKGDCPVNVDMATYKAEFLSHYYERRLRPRQAYAFAFIHVWAKMVSQVPGLASLLNFFTRTPVLRDIAKKVAGIDKARSIPPFAEQTFQQWWAARPAENLDKPKVLLWADTFNSFFHPETARAAVEVLEAAGYQVVVSEKDMCCGRPLYDYGFLNEAKDWLEDILSKIKQEIEDGLPIVVLEPSCATVFRDEMMNLIPGNEDAKRMTNQVFLLSEFLEKYAKEFELPKLHRHALVHGHCHHKAVMKMRDEDSVLKKMEMEFVEPDPGCCGMAGAFGFEEGEHHDVSIKCGELVLLPKVREASLDTIIIADGFSCREQIFQTTSRQGLHLAQVIKMGLKDGPNGPSGDKPEKGYIDQQSSGVPVLALAVAGAFITAAVAGLIGILALQKNKRK